MAREEGSAVAMAAEPGNQPAGRQVRKYGYMKMAAGGRHFAFLGQELKTQLFFLEIVSYISAKKPNMKIGNLLSLKKGFAAYLVDRKTSLAIWLSAACIQGALLNFLFPYPDFFSDSYTYVADAIANLGFSYRPQGYPDYLVHLHKLLPSAGFAVFVQYLLFALSTLFCVSSCGYLFGLTKRQTNWLMAAVLLNPMLVITSNLVSSDSLFCSSTVLWFTSLLWIIKRTGFLNIAIHTLLLLICMHLRYTALFYFAISAITFLVSKGTKVLRVVGVVLSVSAIWGYVNWQETKTEDNFGVRMFSGFGNWQIANNALCYYKKLNVSDDDLPTTETKVLDFAVKRFIDTIYTEGHIGTQYMWDKRSPLKRYVARRCRLENQKYFPEWIKCSEDIGEYGRILIKSDPMAYIKYFMAPNFKNFMVPDLEAIEDYNIYHLTAPDNCKVWYNLDTNVLTPRYQGLEKRMMAVFPYLNCALNVFNIIFIFYFLLQNWKTRKLLRKDILGLFCAWTAFYFGFMAFSVASAYIVFRYLEIIFVLGVIIPVVLYSHSYKSRWPAAIQKE